MQNRILVFACAILMAFLCAITVVAQKTAPAGAQPEAKGKLKKPAEAPRMTNAPAVDAAELEAMKADAKAMRVILNQMRTNLAFVQTTATPLKHQFELEIDMWQVLLDHMQRRIEKMERSGQAAEY